jgi:hypothetical protein
VLWLAIGRGAVEASSETLGDGEIVVFTPGDEPVEFNARSDAEFVLGSAARHPHNLVLDYYSVHTPPKPCGSARRVSTSFDAASSQKADYDPRIGADDFWKPECFTNRDFQTRAPASS